MEYEAEKTDQDFSGDVPIAIIGLALEFPQEAQSVESFWQMIRDGNSASTDFPKDRLNIDAFYHPDGSRQSTIPLRGGNFVKENLAAFDAPFFSVTPAEAACMDPQHRRMLETSYHALEDAGIPLEKCSGTDTSVYTGCFTNDYLSILQQDFEGEQRHAAMGIAPSMLANRLSWFFNFKGTSMNLDSACSSSLVALHLGCQELRAGTSSMALIGGANLVYHPDFMKMMSNFSFLSPNSRCWSFDARANGYARGEGSAVLVIKRLSDAVRDGNTIRAVIRNTGSNQDGRTPGITQPNGKAQMELIERTYKQWNINMEPTRFFEAHGTGTKIGDPEEANAIGKSFQHYRSKEDPLYIGAVKASIGHLEGASGLAGVIKALLVLEKGVIPPIAGFRSLNPQIKANALHLNFPTEALPWPVPGVRRACVNSFGFGGTNAVAILDDAYHYLNYRGLQGYHRTEIIADNLPGIVVNGFPRNEISQKPMKNKNGILSEEFDKEDVSRGAKLLIWSGSEEVSAKMMGDSYVFYLNQYKNDPDDLVYTLAARRTLLAWRSFTVYDPCNGELPIATPASPVKAGSNRRIAFLFTGQGAQYLGMGAGLALFPAFRESLDSSELYLKKIGCTWSLRHFIDGKDKSTPIDRPEYSQVATICLQIAIVDLLKSLGVFPGVVIGHSSGEVAASYAAGILSRSSAVHVAYHRGVLSSRIATEVMDLGMMAVGISGQETIPYLDRLNDREETLQVSIGCFNSPKSVTLTGKASQLTTLEKWFKEDSIFARKLRVPIAYHSKFMESRANEYREALESKVLGNGDTNEIIPMISTVTGDLAIAEIVGKPEYWVQNMISAVRFETAFSKLASQPPKKSRRQLGRDSRQDLLVTHIIEVGPHSTLQGTVRECLAASLHANKPTYISSLDRNQSATVSLLTAVGKLHSAGYPVDILRANRVTEKQRPTPPNMPQYTFNHKHVYWTESRLSENFRFRELARHDLLGTRSLDWNPQMAQWRNVIRISEMPWVEDHQINGEIIFPAAGMIVMAMEALRQLIGDPSILDGIEVKNISFLHPIQFPREKESVETQLNLWTQTQDSDRTPCRNFRLFVIEKRKYIECCSGSIRSAASPPGEVSKILEEWTKETSSLCSRPEEDPYTATTGTAVKYGPCFQNVEHMRVNDSGFAMAEINPNSWKAKGREEFSQHYIIHPSTLDGLAQLLVPALARGKENLPTMVPVRVGSIWVDCSNNGVTHKQKFNAMAECKIRSFRGASADILTTSIDSSCALIYMKALETTFINSTEQSDEQSKVRKLCTSMISKPDVELLSDEQLFIECVRGRPKGSSGAVQKFESLTLSIMAFVNEALEFIEKSPQVRLEGHLQAYVEWMRHQQRVRDAAFPAAKVMLRRLLGNQDAREQLFQQVEESGIDGFFFMHIGRNLTRVLSGEIDPLDIMFKDGLVDRYYESMLANEHHAYPASAYVGLLCFKNPSMKILEIGAGTGGQTLRILESMSSGNIKKWVTYDYTDISPVFFTQARIKFGDYADKMNFRVCDISKSATGQGFEPESYDLVIASHVLHATDNIDQSLRNIRTLLKQGGKLLLFETTKPDALHIGFAFGLLKGWWSPLDHETRSTYSPCLPPKAWNDHLQKTGYSGVDVEIPGQEDPRCLYSSIMIATAVEKNPDSESVTEVELDLIINPKVEEQCEMARVLATQVAICRTYTLADSIKRTSETNGVKVVLLELNAVFLDGMSDSDFDKLRSALVRWKQIIWVTRTASDIPDPQHHLADGLGRTLASEDSMCKFVTFGSCGNEDQNQMGSLIAGLAKRVSNSSVEDCEANYMVVDGVPNISRVSDNTKMDKIVSEAILPYQRKELILGGDTRISLKLPSPGHPQNLEWKSSSEQYKGSPLGENEVFIEVRSFGLTLKDYLAAKGELNDQGIGRECAGIVRIAGSMSKFNSGDRVCLVAPSTSHTTIVVDSSSVVALPDNVSFVEAASMSYALWEAYHTLFNVAKLDEDETVLILDGSSNFGQMAIQLVRGIGAKVLVTSNERSEDAQFLRDVLEIPTEDIILDKPWPKTLCKTSTGQNVDVIIGSLSEGRNGEALEYQQYLAPFGRLVDTGLKRWPVLDSHTFRKATNISHSSVDMIDLLQRKPLMASRAFQAAMERGFTANFRAPQPLHIFSAENIGDAFQNQAVLGKTVVEMASGQTVQASIKTEPRCSFREDATYVIAGGLGGLGRSFARWMASRGARNLVLLSRSGIDINHSRRGAATDLVKELEQQGVCVATPRVDISDAAHLTSVLNDLTKSMPKIRGCIQATVALRDNLFGNMTYEDWSISTRSKVTGSWNLHEALPPGLDFFVLISSVNGIFGGRAQANYAAGNTFKDALAHHRIARGQKAVSIDLGLMVAEGVVAENAFLLASMRRIGHLMDIAQGELIALLDWYCDASLPLLSHVEAQVLVGIEMPSAVMAKGIDLHHSIRRPMFRHLFQVPLSPDGIARVEEGEGTMIDRTILLRKAASDGEAAALVVAWFSAKIAQVLGISEQDINPRRPVHTYGIDSLVAIDLKNWFAREVGAHVEVFELMGNASIELHSAEAALKSAYRAPSRTV